MLALWKISTLSCIALATASTACSSMEVSDSSAPLARGLSADGNTVVATASAGAAGISPAGANNTGTQLSEEQDSVVDGDGNIIAPPVVNLAPEEEIAVRFELPSAGDRFVYAANPSSNSVSVIDSETLAIQTVEAGDKPTFLQTLGGTDAAIVLNVNSDDATIIRTTGSVSKTETVPVVRGSNAIAVSPDGRHAVVYFNVDLRSAGASGSFQDLSVVLLDEARAVDMTVGFRPSSVAFSEDGERAFVITEAGVSILDFARVTSEGSHIARTVSLGIGVGEEALDVSVTPDGDYALARPAGGSVLRLADLRDEGADVRTLDLAQIFVQAELKAAEARTSSDAGATAADAGNAPLDASAAAVTPETADPQAAELAPAPQFTEITDVDLAPSGEFALAVVRGRRTVLSVPIPEAFDDLAAVSVITVGAETVGSVAISPNGERALLYTTAQDDNERITVLDIDTFDVRVVRLPKAVLAVTIAPDGESALIVHRKLVGSPTEPGISADELVDRSFGYSVLQLEDGFSKLQLTQTALGASTIVPDGKYMFVLFNDPALGLQQVHRVGLQSFLVDTIKLGSPPVSVGAVPGANKVFVGQEHPDGRITFIDWNTSMTESVTGFELNSRIRE